MKKGDLLIIKRQGSEQVAAFVERGATACVVMLEHCRQEVLALVGDVRPASFDECEPIRKREAAAGEAIAELRTQLWAGGGRVVYTQ